MDDLPQMRTSNFGISSWNAMRLCLICCKQIEKDPGNCIYRQCNVHSMNLLLGIQQTTFAGTQCTLKMLRTYPSLHHQSSETSLRAIHSFSNKDKPGRFSAVGSDQKLEQTISLSSKCSNGVIGHAKQIQYIAQWDII